MTVFEKIKALLTKANVKFEVLEHEPVHTSADAARVRDTDISMGAKALVMVADKNPILVVVPADKRANFKKLKQKLKIKDLRMATREEVREYTSLEVGSIPPVGKAIGLQSYFDEVFLKKGNVVFNAGLLTTSITMRAKDLVSLENPVIEDLAVE